MYKNVVCRCARLPKYIHTNDLTNRIVVDEHAGMHVKRVELSTLVSPGWLVGYSDF